MISKVYQGVQAFFEAVQLFKTNRSLRNLSLIPAFMTVVFFIFGMAIGIFYLDQALSWIIERNITDYNLFVKTIIYLFSLIIFGMIIYLCTVIVVSLLSIPICVILAQKTLENQGWVPPYKTVGQNFATAIRMTKISVQKFFIFIFVSLVLFGTSFVPLIAPLSLYLTFMLMTFDALDYALEIKEMGLGQRLKYFADHWWEMSGLAICLMVLAIIPIIHILFLPIAVMSASLLFMKGQKV
jgi:uncharacterized protein involved in cysteine biosynthesis